MDSCIQMAKNNYPLIKQNNLIAENQKNDLKIDKSEYLPKLSFNSKASYQSEVISFQGLTFPSDNYLTGISLEQTLYDGGVIKQRLKLDKLTGDNQILENQVELYKIIDRVNELYSNILLTRESIKALNIYIDDIENKTKTNIS
ncbi:MAG TPA: TolC family protein, partial [Saprospiraceae bacterium]|nr:TolC family protein [Saprospiraceae bacterium]